MSLEYIAEETHENNAVRICQKFCAMRAITVRVLFIASLITCLLIFLLSV